MDLTDEQWRLVAPLFPPPPATRRPPLDRRRILDAILWKIRTCNPWELLPPDYPAHQTVYRCYREWQRSGLLEQLFTGLLRDLVHRGGIRPEDLVSEIPLPVCERRYWPLFAEAFANRDWQTSTALVFYGQHLKKIFAIVARKERGPHAIRRSRPHTGFRSSPG